MTRTAPAYFDRLYRLDDDPWGFATSSYERRKYALTVASLPAPRYRSAFEPGCSIGVLTEQLASRCETLLAMEQVASAREHAARRVADSSHVQVVAGTLPEDWPEGPFDLLVLSELCYYFDRQELDWLVRRAVRSLEPEAAIVAVHWRAETDYPLSGAEVHTILAATPTWRPAVHHVDEWFLLDVWQHRP